MFLSHWLRQTNRKTTSTRPMPLGLESLGDRINPSLTATSVTASAAWSDWIDFVAPAATTHLFVLAPESASVGGDASITVVALDASNHRVTDYTGTIEFTSTDPKATLPAEYTFTASDRGIHVFQETPAATGTQTITATDTSDASVTGSASLSVTNGGSTSPVTPAAFDVITMPSTTVGQPTRVAVYAVDANGRPLRDYTGTVSLTSSDADATLPADYTFTKSDHGVHVFTVTFATDGSQQIVATDTTTASATGSATVNVNAAPTVTHFAIAAARSATAGASTQVSVIALDADNHIVQGYTGTVTFTSSDASATLPDDYTFTAADGGVHVFDVTFATTGSETLTATDTSDTSITATKKVNVNAAPVVTSLAVIGEGTVYAGSSTEIAVVALDANSRPVRDYTGTVSFTSTDSSATLPSNYTFTTDDQGYAVFNVTPSAVGTTTITVTDTATKTITGSVTLNVVAAPVVTHLAVIAQPFETAGDSSYVAVVALDASNQPVPNYTGTIHFTDTDSSATLPADYTFTTNDFGVQVFQVTPSATGSETITATDTADATITGSATVTVNAKATSPGGGGWFPLM